MGKIAFIFSGQGAQCQGMGKTFFDGSAAAAEVFKKAEEIRPGTMENCFESPDELLKNTGTTQPCLYTVEMAIAAALKEAGVKADMAAGFSLGEITALAYGGAFSFEDGLKLVMKRGDLMQNVPCDEPMAMGAVIRLSNEKVEEICSRFPNIYPVNFNCPGQVSVSGLASEMEGLNEAVKEAGGAVKVINVSGAFHSPFMTPAADEFAEIIKAKDMAKTDIAVYSNCTGNVYGDDVKKDLIPQINHPVRWETIIRNMIAEGATLFVELGPKKTLCNFNKRIDSSIKSICVSKLEDIQAVLAEAE